MKICPAAEAPASYGMPKQSAHPEEFAYSMFVHKQPKTFRDEGQRVPDMKRQ